MISRTPLPPTALDDAIALHRQGHLDEAEPIYRAFTETQPELTEPWHLLGVIQLQRGHPADAVALFRKALALDPNHVKCRTNMGGALYQMGQLDAAETELNAVLESTPDHIDALFNLGNVLIAQERDHDAALLLQRVLALNPDHAKAHINLGILYSRNFANTEARTSLERALQLAPGDFTALVNLARVLERLNDLDQAHEICAQALAQNPTDPLANLTAAQIDLRARQPQAALGKLNIALAAIENPQALPQLYYMRGEAYDSLHDSARAFAAFEEANACAALDNQQRGIDKNRYLERVEDAHARLAVGPVSPGGGDDFGQPPPVFFVGFPRSGTTLFEQMLRAHPQVRTTNETSPMLPALNDYPSLTSANALDDAQAARIRKSFWREATTLVGDLGDNQRLIDTGPMNIRILDIIARVFPSAPVVMIVRDPRDVCLSCFMQHFNPKLDMLANFVDLDSTVHLYDRIMSLWLNQAQLLNQDRLVIRYEDLITDMPETVQKTLDFIGLPWSEAVLNYRAQARGGHVNTPSYTQVGEKLHTRSKGRWTRYADLMAPYLATLESYVRAFGYRDDLHD